MNDFKWGFIFLSFNAFACRFRPSKEQFPIVVSQDCGHEPTTRVIQSYGDQLTLIQVRNLLN